MFEPERRRSIELPRPPEIPAARRFPLIATLAPIAASAVLFAITRSAFTLMFALLGPVVAVATTADSALHRARTRRREESRFLAALEQTQRQIDEVHALERDDLNRVLPGARGVLSHPSGTWRSGSHPATTIRLGSGELPSALTLATIASGATSDNAAARLDALRSSAERVAGAPISADVAGGVTISGPRLLAPSAARAVLLQLAAQLSPDDVRIQAPTGTEWDWLGELPHAVTRAAPAATVRFDGGATGFEVVVASSSEQLPRGPGLRVDIGGTGGARFESADGPVAFSPEFVSLESAMGAARALRDVARNAGLGIAGELVKRLEFGELAQRGASGLAAAIGVTETGPLVIDLASDGPHAIVGGTTGSGKSELLVSWVLGIAAERPPSLVTFLFVDFKGGAAFDRLLRLPHSVGVITDLDAGQSLRALASLGAELRYRERTLAACGLASIDDQGNAPPFPRLIVVVDEYAALIETHSSLHAVFADIAARGRSLGVHLVLCTQRPAGVVRDGILANCALRISLRVMAAADSTAVIGTDGAASLPARPAGRALVSIAGDAPRLFQVAHAGREDADGITTRWTASGAPRAPWLPPLPSRIELDAVVAPPEAGAVAFALEDRPEEQTQQPALYRPAGHGSLLVVGAGRSGKSGVLAALAAAPSDLTIEHLPRDLPQLWDALRSMSGTGSRLMLIDDLDAIVAGCDENYRTALLDLLASLLREGPGAGSHLVVTVQRVGSTLQSLAGLFGTSLLLRMPNRQEHLIAGGSAADYSQSLPPGAGHWAGHRIQVFATDIAPPLPPEARVVELSLTTSPIAAISTRPAQFAERLRGLAPHRRVVVVGPPRFESHEPDLEVHSGGSPDILVGDPDSWQSQWSTFTALQRTTDLLFDGCSLAEIRTLTRSRELPPPFARGERALWLKPVDGDFVRARLPEPGG